MSKRILVTGAAGRLGSAVVAELARAGATVRAMVHDSDPAAPFPSPVQVSVGDLADPATLSASLRDVDTVFLVWSAPGDSAAAVVDALAVSVRRVVFLSAPHRTAHPFFSQPNPMATLYASIEDRIVSSGLSWAFLRPGMLDSNALLWWGPAIRAGDPIRWPYTEVETAPVHDGDVIDVVARVLLDDRYSAADYVLTGPEPISQRRQAEVIAEVTGLPVTCEELTADEFRAATAGAWPPSVVSMLLDAWRATEGVPPYVSSDVESVLGRPARTFNQWVADNASAFR